MKCLGVDISTSSIGFCQMDLFGLTAFSVDLHLYESHKYRREIIRESLLLFNPDFIVLESVRLFHRNFINVDVIKRLGGITYLIVDFFGCPVYNIDVRSWKSIIFGTRHITKTNNKVEKEALRQKEKDYSICYIEKKYDIIGNNDLADSICLAEVGMLKKRYENKFKRIE